MRWTMVYTLLVSFLLASCEKPHAPPPPPPVVKTMIVPRRTVPVAREWIGQTRGSVNVEIRARVEGFLKSVNFTEGSFVKAGDLLYVIDPAEYNARLGEARGRLAQHEANLARAHNDVVRYEPLVRENAISREEYETAVQYEKAQIAAVDAATSYVQKALLDLGYCSVKAPISGLAGKTEVQIGNLVGRGENTLLTTVSTIDPIRVRFSLSEQEVITFRRNTRGADPRSIELIMVLADGSVHPYAGRLVLADNAVDVNTGTLLLEAEFPNPDKFVRPGQFARVRAIVQKKQDAIVIPARAVSELQGQARVAVLGQKNVVSFRNVMLGPMVGNTYVVEAGLEPGEQIVVDGLQKVREGIPVKPQMVEISIDSLIAR